MNVINTRAVNDYSVFSGVVFIYLSGNQEFITASFNNKDKLRLIYVPDTVISLVEDVVREQWRKGIQKIQDARPQLYEIKLRGNPWSTHGRIKFEVFFSR